MATESVTVLIRTAWWVRPYIMTCVVFSVLHGMTVNADKISRFVARYGIRIKVQ